MEPNHDYYCPEHNYNPPKGSGFAMCPKCESQSEQPAHTPGPWQVWKQDACKVQAATGMVIVDFGIECHRLKRGVNEAKANARLIAAAPELLDALRGCVVKYEDFRDSQPVDMRRPEPDFIKIARHALAKAEGKS